MFIQLFAMPFKPPLTFDELRAISARSPAGSDGRALLWEIKRLQDRLRRVAQYLHGGSSQYGVIYDALITELNGEPAVQWCKLGTLKHGCVLWRSPPSLVPLICPHSRVVTSDTLGMPVTV